MAATLLVPSTSDTSFGGASQKLLNTSSMTSPTRTLEGLTPDLIQSAVVPVSHGFTTQTNKDWDRTLTQKPNDPIRSSASALDALATLATSTIISSSSHIHTTTTTTTTDDFESMPPPPPRRSRSASNPEGMEKWDSYRNTSSRCHFVLPTSILEEEMASADVACRAHDEEMARHRSTPPGPAHGRTVFRLASHPLHRHRTPRDDGAPPVGTASPEGEGGTDSTASSSCCESEGGEEGDPERDLEPEELLRRARSRLLEDLATETSVQKSVLPLPHALDKYKELYNKNGRIGIYTPLERAAIIAKFNSKRGRRVWNKKIRYNCRKNLADRRMRVKGRFVKRAVEQQKAVVKPARNTRSGAAGRTASPVLSCGSLSVVVDGLSVGVDGDEDVDMPDVNDPDAEFRPTKSQPYRRVRRHTIT